jgi:hypothetical protein
MVIEVRVSENKVTQLAHAVHVGNYILRQLKDAGIPMRGTLYPLAPEYGVLEIEADQLTGDEIIYRWHE